MLKKWLGIWGILLLFGLGMIPDTQAALICGDFIPRRGEEASLYGIDTGNAVRKTGVMTSVWQDGIRYQVQAGDTLWDIARRQGVSCEMLQQMNPEVTPECLQIGQLLQLPTGRVSIRENVTPVSRGGSSGDDFIWPLTGVITSGFGERSSGSHHGIDIAGNTGDPVRASAAGTVRKAMWHDIYGNMVLLEHPGDRQTLYAHLSKIRVAPGEKAACGQIIGEVGSTGRSTGPHLHFEIRKAQRAVNPMPYLPR